MSLYSPDQILDLRMEMAKQRSLVTLVEYALMKLVSRYLFVI